MKRAAGRRDPPGAGQGDGAQPRSASPYLRNLERQAASPLGATSAPPTVSGALPSAGIRSSLLQQRATTAAQLQALLTKTHHVSFKNGKLGGGKGGQAPQRPASALQHRKPAVPTRAAAQPRSASAMAMRDLHRDLHRAAAAAVGAPKAAGLVQGPTSLQQQLGAGLPGQPALASASAASVGQPAAGSLAAATASVPLLPAARQQRAGSRLGRPPGMAGHGADGLAGSSPLGLPAGLAAHKQPGQQQQQQQGPGSAASPAQLPALQGGSRPPSRLQQYAGDSTAPPPLPESAGKAPGSDTGPHQQQQRPGGVHASSPLPPVRPFSASRPGSHQLLRSKSVCVSMVARPSVVGAAPADVAALLAVTSEARQVWQQQQQQQADQHSSIQQQQEQHRRQQEQAEQQQRADALSQQLAAAGTASELQAVADEAVAWLASQLSPSACSLLRQLVAALTQAAADARGQASGDGSLSATDSALASSSSGGSGGDGRSSDGGSGAQAAGAKQARPHQLFQQCNALRGDKAALERLNKELSSQVQAYQQQLSALHLRVDNLLLDRQRLQEEAGDQAAAQAAVAAEAAQLRQRLSVAEAEVAVARGRSSGSSAAAGQASGGGGGGGGQPGDAGRGPPVSGRVGALVAGLQARPSTEDGEVSWGRSLTARAPAARPSNVPPVDLSRLRVLLPGRK